MYQPILPAPALSGNRCLHDPSNPRLSPPEPIRKGLGGLPRILSLAAEWAKEWFYLHHALTLFTRFRINVDICELTALPR